MSRKIKEGFVRNSFYLMEIVYFTIKLCLPEWVNLIERTRFTVSHFNAERSSSTKSIKIIKTINLINY